MAKQGRRQYTEEFKREAVNLVDEQGRGIAEVARSLGVHRSQVERWRAQYGRGSAPSAVGGQGAEGRRGRGAQAAAGRGQAVFIQTLPPAISAPPR
jgi:transposase-like protein